MQLTVNNLSYSFKYACFFFPVYFNAFYSIESIFEVTPNPKQMEDNEEKTEKVKA